MSHSLPVSQYINFCPLKIPMKVSLYLKSGSDTIDSYKEMGKVTCYLPALYQEKIQEAKNLQISIHLPVNRCRQIEICKVFAS